MKVLLAKGGEVVAHSPKNLKNKIPFFARTTNGTPGTSYPKRFNKKRRATYG